MKKLFVAILISSLFSCATTNTTTVNRHLPERPYSRIMVVTVTQAEELYKFDEEYYNKNIRLKFNNIHDLKFREHLEKALVRTLERESGFPSVTKSVDVFTPLEDYTYEQFIEKYKQAGCQALLIVNLSDYWETEKYVTNHGEYYSSTRVETQPNHAYLCHLVDQDDLQRIAWVGKIGAFGILAGYDTLNNHLARRVASSLRKGKYIF